MRRDVRTTAYGPVDRGRGRWYGSKASQPRKLRALGAWRNGLLTARPVPCANCLSARALPLGWPFLDVPLPWRPLRAHDFAITGGADRKRSYCWSCTVQARSLHACASREKRCLFSSTVIPASLQCYMCGGSQIGVSGGLWTLSRDLR